MVRGETTGFAHTADLSERGLTAAAEAAAAASTESGAAVRVAALPTTPTGRERAPAAVLPETVSKDAKVALLQRADVAARERSGSIRQVSAAYADGRRRILVASSDGVLAEDDQVRTRFMVTAVAEGDTGLHTGTEAPGRTLGFELFDEIDPAAVARIAADRALTLLQARPAPSGRLPVVLKRGAGGVLFHEACGHGLESDLVRRDASVFRNKVGEAVASPLVTVVDDGTYGHEWGTFAIDDEGTPARRNVLIEDGVLTDYMWDLVRSRAAGRPSSGNGRRETYRHLPMVRMTNTYLLPGATDPDDIIADTPYGLYCVALGGGQVNTATGDFVFGVTEAYLIEDGRDHRAGPCRPAHRQRLRRAAPRRRGGQRLRHLGRHLRQGGPGRPGLVGPAHAAGRRADRGRDRRVSGLPEVVRGIVEKAVPGEQVEAYAAHSLDTDVKVFEGRVEEMAVAESGGVGVRVVVDGRLGYAWVGIARGRTSSPGCSTKPATTPASPRPTSGTTCPRPPTPAPCRSRPRPLARRPRRGAHDREGRARPRAGAGRRGARSAGARAWSRRSYGDAAMESARRQLARRGGVVAAHGHLVQRERARRRG